MDLIEGLGIGVDAYIERHPSEEILHVRPSDPRAWHCQTVEEYRLFKYSTSYDGYESGVIDNFSVDFSGRLD